MPAHTNLGIPPIAERFLEMIPGLLSWGFMASIVFFSFVDILIAAGIVVAFAILWLLKIFGYSRRLVNGYGLMRTLKSIDWNKNLKDLKDVDESFTRVNRQLLDKKTPRSLKKALRRYKTLLLHAREMEQEVLDPDEVMHATIIAAYNESRDVIEPTIKSLIESNYNVKKQVILVLAYEERGGPEIEKTAKDLVKKYKKHFKVAWAVKHPKDIPGEAKAKAGNITYAAKKVTQYAKKHKITAENMIVTTLDADNRPSEDYLAYLTYIYCVSENRIQKSYQPMAMFFNNIWDAPAVTRVIATSNSFWLLMEAMRPHRLRNFSAHAQSLQTLIDTNYWNVASIVEDGHQYWRTFFTYEGEHTVVPIYTAIYQDAVLADGYLKTFRAQFVQLRRWAYGVSDTPYVIVQSFRDKAIPWPKKIVHLARQIEGYFSWATAPIILAIGGWVPLLVNTFSTTDITAHQLPTLVSFIQTASLIGLLGPIVASMKSLPPRPKRYTPIRSVMMLLQWVLVPVAMILFGSTAALNAQTRLMFGAYLENFDVTEKKRVDKPSESSEF